MAEAAGQMRPMTFGERAVGLDFNPSGDEAVAEIKQWFAQIIDELDQLRNDGRSSNELRRLCSIAITEAQGAQMWAVKSLTWRDGK